MTDDLVKRLRELNTFEWHARPATTKETCFTAADRIEELERHASLHAKCDQTSLEIEQKLVEKLKDAHKRIEQLVLALYGVIAIADRDCPEFRVARAVLKGEEAK